jgi:hypothetical protein
MKFILDDGGRKDAGYRGLTGDCVCRSIAIVTEKQYKEVYDALNQLSKEEHRYVMSIESKRCVYNLKKTKHETPSSRTGINKKIYDKYLKSLGYKWVATMGIGTGCKIHLSEEELPMGRLIVQVSKHLTTVIDGVIHDTWDCSRNETRCVYGYYIKDIENSN